MIEFTHEVIERLWNSIVHYVPERQKLDMAIDFIKSKNDDEPFFVYLAHSMLLLKQMIFDRCLQ